MLKRLKIQIYPNKAQEELLERHINAYRYLYNLCLEYKNHLYQYHKISISGISMQNELFELIKDIPWMRGLKVECLRQAALDVESTFKMFYSGQGFPKFKSKKNNFSFSVHQHLRIKNNKFCFFKQRLKFKTSPEYNDILVNNHIKQCVFVKDKTHKWFISCLVDNNDNFKSLPKLANIIGIDLGINKFIVTSNGEYINNPNLRNKLKKKLIRIERKHSKSKKGGKNREKLRVKLATVHKKITNQKKHFFHKISNKLIFENQEIHVETLPIRNMLKNKKLARVISDISWSSFITILEYKCNWYGRKLVKVSTWFPSSKLCSSCGYKKKKLELLERIYKCENCGLEMDRDLNAAKNLASYSPTVKNTGSNVSGNLIRP